MTTSKYPSYKDVPIPWVVSIPEHWDWKPVLGAASERDEDNKGMKEDNLLSLSYGNIVNKDINTSDGLLPESFETYQIVRPGDIVLRLTDLQNDKRSLRSALVTQTGIITSAYLALKPESIDPKYLGYLLRAYDVSKVFYSMGGGLRQSMKYGDIKRMPLVIPTKAEQLSIATFLDRETAKIDALIAEQQRLIELLQEKRQAVISHAVTKGLNPDVPMKDSGVEWLGEVPEHWSVVEARREIDFLTSGSRGWAEFYSDNGYLFLRIGNLTRDSIDLDLEDIQRVSPPDGAEGARTEVKEGDVLFSITAYLGSVAVVPEALERAYVSQHVCLARLNGKNLLPKWLANAVLSTSGRAYLEAESYGGTKIQLSLDDIKSFPLAFPPLEEQKIIIEHLQGSVAKLKSLRSDCEANIALLQERRSALISAAVTGQIDVRGLAEAEEEVA